jgi:Ca2+-binding RTX toxin-like protein
MGTGGDILVGDGSNNVLTENAGNNLVIGGGGADILTGGSGEDILIAGTTVYDRNIVALDALLATWDNPTLSYSQRVAELRNGVSYPADAGTLTADLIADTTVSQPADSGRSNLNGGSSGLDWFFAAQTDKVIKKNNMGEIVSTL